MLVAAFEIIMLWMVLSSCLCSDVLGWPAVSTKASRFEKDATTQHPQNIPPKFGTGNGKGRPKEHFFGGGME